MENSPLHSLEDLSSEVTRLAEAPETSLLKKVLQTQIVIKKRKKSHITFSQPIITCDGRPVLFPRTINVIQGQNGVHKSRVAEIFTAALLSDYRTTSNLLGFRKDSLFEPHVVYLDTERNLLDQFPAAIQSIQRLTGVNHEVDIDGFEFSSLIDVPRDQRFEALRQFLTYLRKNTDKEMVVVLDVLSDCIQDFNSASDSLTLIDMMNEMINHHNVTFIAIIHENPGSQKARGHLGTELTNKASTVLQVSLMDSIDPKSDQLVKISYLKCRSSERHPDMLVKYSKEERTLVLADESEMQQALTSRQVKAPVHEIKDSVRVHLNKLGAMKKVELIELLSEAFACSPNTIRERIQTLIDTQTPIVDKESHTTKTLIERKEGRIVWLELSTPLLPE